MYKTDYFIRFVSGRQMAEADLARGFSYYGYDEDNPLGGLSGYGPYESVREALENASGKVQGYDHVAIFIGKYIGPDPDSGDLFEPRKLVSVHRI